MANDLKYVGTLSNNMLDEITALIDAGTGAGTLRIYEGTAPADADTALAGGGANDLIAQLTMSDPSAGAAASDVWTANSITDDTAADITSTATFFRVLDSDANVVLQGTVGLDTGTFDLELNDTAITINDNVAVSAFTITEGNT